MNAPVRQRSDLRNAQRIISSIVKGDPAKLIISGMGSGKTGATLDGLYDLLSRFEVQHVLVIAPRFVAANTWPDEINTWRHTRALSYAVAVGEPEERLAAIKRRAEITTINFENLPWLAQTIRTVDNWYWDTVVIDESSRMKSGEGRTKPAKVKTVTAEGKIVHKVRKGGNQTRFGIMTTARRKISRVIELTGTPAPKGLIDLWAQAYLLDQGQRLGRDKSEFERRWFDKDEYTHTVEPKPGAEADILERLQDLLVTIPQEKVCEDAQFVPMKVRLPERAMHDYREFERTLLCEPYDVEAVSNGVLANKLLQFANGHMYKEDRSVVHIHDAKMEALDELIETAQGENLLVFYGFKFDKDAIRKRYPHAVVANESKDFVSDWNKNKIRLGLAHPASIGHGTNLQYGGHLAAWYGLTFSLELWMQANMRLPRPGQREQVLIYPIIAEGTYDERALTILNDRDATQDRIIRNFTLRT
ncbi:MULTISPECIES: SNF2-related protein [unclassified Mesorhizobium]|uniref:SNF2-related protein n=1 Tax=unclassified Mesorhizobium TaxID=325217 RepID=UPI001093A738|nr:MULTISPECIES: SNF2-related protein [unclassified Mesorhizobium]TGT90852.1 DEAD/DEAH box helicase [Mesorhizobium sp. M8A.F.Ca.ET.161.01.1.1]TGV43869.1 DEAD/DEAH box helicase [Mesorhizobium sp. M8A.F.Ca.ET.142.01.1.1]